MSHEGILGNTPAKRAETATPVDYDTISTKLNEAKGSAGKTGRIADEVIELLTNRIGQMGVYEAEKASNVLERSVGGTSFRNEETREKIRNLRQTIQSIFEKKDATNN